MSDSKALWGKEQCVPSEGDESQRKEGRENLGTEWGVAFGWLKKQLEISTDQTATAQPCAGGIWGLGEADGGQQWLWGHLAMGMDKTGVTEINCNKESLFEAVNLG